MKSITINSSIIYIIILLVFVAYCYFSYKVFTASTSKQVLDGDAVDSEGNVTDVSTLKKFFDNVGILSIMTPIIIVLLIILIFFDSS